jgi:hypothetical protein
MQEGGGVVDERDCHLGRVLDYMRIGHNET